MRCPLGGSGAAGDATVFEYSDTDRKTKAAASEEPPPEESGGRRRKKQRAGSAPVPKQMRNQMPKGPAEGSTISSSSAASASSGRRRRKARRLSSDEEDDDDDDDDFAEQPARTRPKLLPVPAPTGAQLLAAVQAVIRGSAEPGALTLKTIRQAVEAQIGLAAGALDKRKSEIKELVLSARSMQ